VIGSLIAAGRTIHQPPPPSLAGSIPEFVIAGLLALLGLRSLRKWMGMRFPATSTKEQVVYALNVTTRVGMWFALAGFFVGYALVDDPQGLGWYLFVLLGLASVQLLSTFYLGRSTLLPDGPRTGESKGPGGGNGGGMALEDPDHIRKEGESFEPGERQPKAEEVESARLLANEAMDVLVAGGFTRDDVRRFADEYIARHLGEGMPEFIEWAKKRAGRSTGA
jgi:hypothetical protein